MDTFGTLLHNVSSRHKWLVIKSIETQSHGLYLLVVNDLLYIFIALKQDEEELLVKPALAILDHKQILGEVMSVYQSSFLGNDEDAHILR